MRVRAIRSVVRSGPTRSRAGARCTRGTTCSASSRACTASRPGHTGAAGWCEVAAVQRNGVTLYTTRARKPDAFAAQHRSRLAARAGASRATGRCGSCRVGACTCGRGVGYGKAAVPIVAAQQVARDRADRPAARRARDRSDGARAPGRTRTARRRSEDLLRRRLVARQPLVAERRVAKPAFGGAIGLLRGQDASVTWETGSRDRDGHAQRRDRPDADCAELPARPAAPREPGAHARRRQGHQRRARAQAARRSRSSRPGWRAGAQGRASSRS